MAGPCQSSFNTCAKRPDTQKAMQQLHEMSPFEGGGSLMGQNAARARADALKEMGHSNDHEVRNGAMRLQEAARHDQHHQKPSENHPPIGVLSEHAKRMQRMQSRPGGMGM